MAAVGRDASDGLGWPDASGDDRTGGWTVEIGRSDGADPETDERRDEMLALEPTMDAGRDVDRGTAYLGWRSDSAEAELRSVALDGDDGERGCGDALSSCVSKETVEPSWCECRGDWFQKARKRELCEG